MSIGSIPFTAIHEYYKIFDVGQYEEFEEFLYYMRVMDRKFLHLEAEKQKTKAK